MKLSPSHILLLFLLCTMDAYGQEAVNVTGRIFDRDAGTPVAHAHIIVNDSQQGTSAGMDGSFELELAPGIYHITVSAVGYRDKTMELRVPEDTGVPVRIGLAAKSIVMDDVFVFGEYFFPNRDTSIASEPVSLTHSISRVSSFEIQRQGAVTVTDAVKFIPGGLTETRGRKTRQFFSVRGQRYPYPDYAIDGVWQREFEETHYFFSALDIESIEVVRSGNALVKGLNGLSGLIDIRTKKPERETVSLTARYGQLNNFVTGVRYGNALDDITFGVSATMFGTDGPSGRRGNERISNFHGTLDWQINPDATLTAGSTYIYGKREFVQIIEPGSPNLLNREEAFDPVHTFLTYAKLGYRWSDLSRTELQTNIAWRDARFTMYEINEASSSSHHETDYEFGINLLHSYSVGRSTLVRVGALYNYWIAPDGKRYYAGRRADLHTWSGVLAAEHRTGRFIFDAGFRLTGGYINEFGGFGIEGSAAGFRNVEPLRDQYAPVEWQTALGGTWLIAGPVSLHYNFAGGAVSPRKGSIDADGSTPENEIRLQHDLGLVFRALHQTELSTGVFYTQRKNALQLSGETVTTGDGHLVELYENRNQRSYGIEVTGRRYFPRLHSYLFANTVFMKGEEEVDGTMTGDRKLPEVILNFGYLFNYSGFDANLYVHHTGPYTNNRFVNRSWLDENGDYPLGDFYSVDLTTGYTINRSFRTRIFVEVKNLLDEKYETVAGYPDPGRMIQGGLRMDW